MLNRIAFGIVALLGLTVVAAAAIPGPQRALCPTCFGMSEIADNIYLDTSDEKVRNSLLADIQTAQKAVENYLGSYNATPRILFCTREDGACLKLFGDKGTIGISWGKALVRLNPEGLNTTIMTHELLHTELALRMGQFGMWNNVIPKWFNEGLATYVSGDDRFAYDYSDDEKAWARNILSYHDWKREVNENTWPQAYGASAQMVRDIEQDVGQDGIRELIRRVTEAGEPFEVVLKELTSH
ncbi:MAG: hypothetical protein U5K75_07090 [Ahrensia sp.]|nr:hypothetical protein [Ahrensia sp.]